MKTKYLSLFILSFLMIIFTISCEKNEPTDTNNGNNNNNGTPTTTKSSAKDITKFSFAALSPAVDATIDATNKTISATVPAATDVTKLVPTITISDKATISPNTGVAQDFSKEVRYTVTAEDGSTAVWKVAVSVPKVTSITIDCNNIPDVLEDLGDGVDYIVSCNLSLRKPLTIKAGVRIQFDNNAGIWCSGSDNYYMSLIGTKEKPIILESKSGVVGSWNGIFISSPNLKNEWEYVTLRQAAGATYSNVTNAGLQIGGDTRISIKNCTFSDNQAYGVALTYAIKEKSVFTAFENNTFKNNKKSAMRIAFADMGALDSKSTFVNNGQKYIEVFKQPGYFIDDNMVVNKLLDVPFRITDFIQIYDINITLNAGVAIEFGTDAGFMPSGKGTLTASGTATEPVKLTGYTSGKGIWAGILFDSNKPENKLNYCVIDGAGSTSMSTTNFNFWYEKNAKAAIVFDGTTYKGSYRGTVTNCTISNSGGYGIAYSVYSKDDVTVSGNTFNNNTKDNVVVFSY